MGKWQARPLEEHAVVLFFSSFYLAAVLVNHHVKALDCSSHHEVAILMANTVQKLRLLEQQTPTLGLLESGDPRSHTAICMSAKRKATALRIIAAKSNGIVNNTFAEVDAHCGWEWALI